MAPIADSHSYKPATQWFLQMFGSRQSWLEYLDSVPSFVRLVGHESLLFGAFLAGFQLIGTSLKLLAEINGDPGFIICRHF